MKTESTINELTNQIKLLIETLQSQASKTNLNPNADSFEPATQKHPYPLRQAFAVLFFVTP